MHHLPGERKRSVRDCQTEKLFISFLSPPKGLSTMCPTGSGETQRDRKSSQSAIAYSRPGLLLLTQKNTDIFASMPDLVSRALGSGSTAIFQALHDAGMSTDSLAAGDKKVPLLRFVNTVPSKTVFTNGR